jgi:signal transduction histidine kinase/CheY-like chemotaxis protein
MQKTRLAILTRCSILVLFWFSITNIAAHETQKISQIETQLETADAGQKAHLLQQLVEEYESIDKQKQIGYVKQILDMHDSLVEPGLKSDMYKLLSDFYKNKQKDKTVVASPSGLQGRSAADYLSIIVFVVSLLLMVAVVAWYLLTTKKHEALLKDAEDRAEKVYKEKYEAQNAMEERLETELQPLKGELRKMEARESELKKTLKNLEEANYLKNAFLSNISHEIRTSLNGISGFAGILEIELALIADENLYGHAQKIQQSGSKLESLLSNIIEISKIEANVIEKEIKEYELSGIISFVDTTNTFKANEKGIVFKSKIEQNIPMVLADNEKLKRVLNELIDNALKYTNKGFVTIAGSFDEQTNKIKIEVKDTGIGFPDDYAKLISKAFGSEVDEIEKSYQGIGIGLKLCKKFINLMGGTISIETSEGKGSSFTILLDAAPTEDSEIHKGATAPEPTLINAPELGLLDIFIVEDDRMNRMVLEKMLKKSGSITTAADGENALKILQKHHKKKHHFHVMLFDINLPAPWDGIRLMQEIRRLYPEYKRIPFIAQTAFAMAGDKNRFLDQGFDDYIAKPIVKNELLTLIEKQIIKFSN